jgi:hypothetical protein
MRRLILVDGVQWYSNMLVEEDRLPAGVFRLNCCKVCIICHIRFVLGCVQLHNTWNSDDYCLVVFKSGPGRHMDS